MEQAPLKSFKSHIDGKNADVEIYPDRIEWGRSGKVSLTRMTAGVATMGASLAKTGLRKGGGSEMIPIKSLSSVTAGKDGLRFYKVTLITTGNTIDFRVDKKTAEDVKSLVTQLILGTHPTQQTAPAEQPSSAPTPPPPSGSMADELTKLAQLRDSGVLSPEEFDAQKARLLGG